MLDSCCLPFLLLGGLGWVLAALFGYMSWKAMGNTENALDTIHGLRADLWDSKRRRDNWKREARDAKIWARKNREKNRHLRRERRDLQKKLEEKQ